MDKCKVVKISRKKDNSIVITIKPNASFNRYISENTFEEQQTLLEEDLSNFNYGKILLNLFATHTR